MNVTCQDSLARTAFTLNKERHIRGGECWDLFTELLHDWRTAEDQFVWWQVIGPKSKWNSLCDGPDHCQLHRGVKTLRSPRGATELLRQSELLLAQIFRIFPIQHSFQTAVIVEGLVRNALAFAYPANRGDTRIATGASAFGNPDSADSQSFHLNGGVPRS